MLATSSAQKRACAREREREREKWREPHMGHAIGRGESQVTTMQTASCKQHIVQFLIKGCLGTSSALDGRTPLGQPEGWSKSNRMAGTMVPATFNPNEGVLVKVVASLPRGSPSGCGSSAAEKMPQLGSPWFHPPTTIQCHSHFPWGLPTPGSRKRTGTTATSRSFLQTRTLAFITTSW